VHKTTVRYRIVCFVTGSKGKRARKRTPGGTIANFMQVEMFWCFVYRSKLKLLEFHFKLFITYPT